MPYHTLLIQQFEAMVDDYLIIGFTWAVIADIATGYFKAWRATTTGRKTNSTKGLFGLTKHLLVLSLVLTLYPYLMSLGYSLAAQGILVAMMYNYIVSIIENLGQAGIYVPEFVKQRLSKLQDDYNPADFDPILGTKKKEDK